MRAKKTCSSWIQDNLKFFEVNNLSNVSAVVVKQKSEPTIGLPIK